MNHGGREGRRRGAGEVGGNQPRHIPGNMESLHEWGFTLLRHSWEF